MGRQSLRTYTYTLFVVTMLMMSWETSLAGAAVIAPSIPEESIRIRILANSDSVEDQWIKREIRAAVVSEIDSWGDTYSGIEEARARIRSQLSGLERRMNEMLNQYGFPYRARVELGKVDFPSKVFGKRLYPAGEYEALRITLGAGLGENWWCVLFPPLCFGGGAVKAKAEQDVAVMEALASVDPALLTKKTDGGNDNEVEVRFFLIDAGKKVATFLKALTVS